MVDIAAYFDESRNFDETDGSPGVVAVAGYLGPVTMWEESFTPAWRAVLARAPKPVSEFKAADCRHRVGEFKGWSREECDALTRDLIDVITDPAHALIGFGAAVLMQEALFTSIVRQQNRHHFAYWWCVSGVTRDAINLARHQPGEVDTLQCVFDEEKDLWSQATQGFGHVRESSGEFAKRVLPPMSGRSHDLPPLQAADLLAYETYKELRNRHEGRDPSRALVRLVSSKWHQGYWAPLPFILACLALDEAGVDIPESRGHRIYDSTASPQICRGAPRSPRLRGRPPEL